MYQLAHINVARLLAPMDSPLIKDFVDSLDRINTLAEAAPGFIWRLKDDSNAASVFNDPLMVVNISVWENVAALYDYTYYSPHVEVYRRRQEWFATLESPHMALWWIPAGHLPTLEEGKAKLSLLAEQGPSPLAFTFKQRFSVEEMLAFSTKKVTA